MLNGWFATDSVGMENQQSALGNQLQINTQFFLIRAIVDSRQNLASSDSINGIIGLAPSNDADHPSYI